MNAKRKITAALTGTRPPRAFMNESSHKESPRLLFLNDFADPGFLAGSLTLDFLPGLDLRQALFDIPENVLDILDANREPYQFGCQTAFALLLFGKLRMRRTGRV